MRAVLVPTLAAWLVLAGCGGSPPAARRVSARPAPVDDGEHAEAAPAARPPPASGELRPSPSPWPWAWDDGQAPLRRPWNLSDPDDPLAPINLAQRRGREVPARKSDYWSPCVRAFVQTQPADARELLGEALSLYGTSCSAERVEFRVPRARRAPPQSQLGLVGAVGRTTALALRAAYHGTPLAAERLTLIADGVRWSSPRINFDTDGGGEVATLPLTRTLARVVRRVIDARDALLRFESATTYEDVAISDELKQELRVMLDALEARDAAERVSRP